MDKGYLYQCPPIDWWDGWTDMEMISMKCADNIGDCPCNNSLTEAFVMVAEAIYLATKYGYYDGDINTVKVSGLPDGTSDSKLMVGIKISNNGTTYIYSKIQLPWLHEFEMDIPRKQK